MTTDFHLRRLDAARLRMATAKRHLTLATHAVMHGEPGASEGAYKAMAELSAARRELNALLDQAPGERALARGMLGEE